MRLANQDEKRDLKGIVGIVSIAEQPPAHAQDHRGVPSQQHRESGLVAVVEESAQQLAVGCGVVLQPCDGMAEPPRRVVVAAVVMVAPWVLPSCSPKRGGASIFFVYVSRPPRVS
jgi:hypothetical protein